jgi:hypothetical protein
MPFMMYGGPLDKKEPAKYFDKTGLDEAALKEALNRKVEQIASGLQALRSGMDFMRWFKGIQDMAHGIVFSAGELVSDDLEHPFVLVFAHDGLERHIQGTLEADPISYMRFLTGTFEGFKHECSNRHGSELSAYLSGELLIAGTAPGNTPLIRDFATSVQDISLREDRYADDLGILIANDVFTHLHDKNIRQESVSDPEMTRLAINAMRRRKVGLTVRDDVKGKAMKHLGRDMPKRPERLRS